MSVSRKRGERRLEFSHGRAEVVADPLCDRFGHGAAKRGCRHDGNERAIRHRDAFEPHDVRGPALTRPIESRLMRKSCNLREAQCAVRWPRLSVTAGPQARAPVKRSGRWAVAPLAVATSPCPLPDRKPPKKRGLGRAISSPYVSLSSPQPFQRHLDFCCRVVDPVCSGFQIVGRYFK